ncbi:MAG: hypothetical protein FWC91_04035 [Defluviitaleaceae bacterium]|nr:hypothetical protein [Defluviitaleaceae bacterium]
MDSIEIELKVLIECLKKKKLVLKQIVSITENQGVVLSSGASHNEIYTFFMHMNAEKQESIEKVLQYDQVFDDMLQKAGPILDANPSKYGEQVRTLQDLIRSVMDLDVQVRVAEDQNNKILLQAQSQGGFNVIAEKAEKPEPIDSGEYGSNKVINAYKNQSRHNL